MSVIRSIQNIQKVSTLLLPISRHYAFKSNLKIKWVRPEKIPCFKPEKSGDLEGIPVIDENEIQLQFRNSKELKDADNVVKRLFSLEFAPKRKNTSLYISNMVQTVKRHPFDVGSIEVKIARMTGVIRSFQETMDKFPRNKKLKVELKEMIEKRKKYLKYLRQWDYKRFEWLLEVLNIVYKPPPKDFSAVTRKSSLRKLTDIYCENIKNERLEAFKKTLQEEQPDFLKEKIHTLEFIRQEQIDCGVEVTVSEEDIENVRQQLEALIKKRKEEKKEQ